MKKRILLSFADADFTVRPEIAERVKQVVQPDRYDTTTIEELDPPTTTRLTGARQSKSVFERAQPPSQLTPRQQQLAERLSKRLSLPPSKKSSI